MQLLNSLAVKQSSALCVDHLRTQTTWSLRPSLLPLPIYSSVFRHGSYYYYHYRRQIHSRANRPAAKMSATAALPQALQSITDTKITELNKQRALYETRKASILNEANSQPNLRDKVRVLLEGVTWLKGYPDDGLDTSDKDDTDHTWDATGDMSTRSRYRNMRRFLFQARYDSSISEGMLLRWEEELKRELDMRSVKHDHALFFSRLVTEWLTHPDEPTTEDEEGIEGSFEPVGREEMYQQRAEWESLVFEPCQTDTAAIDSYLNKLFLRTRLSEQALKDLRKSVKNFSKTMLADQQAFTPASLKWVVQGVIESDLFPPEKVTILKGFLENENVAQEVADVLNMRLAQLNEGWSWSSESIPIEMRRQLNGKYRVFMNEDLLDALFLEYIGVQWGVKFKWLFKTFFNSHAWKSNSQTIPKRDLERRQYFLYEDPKENLRTHEVNVHNTRRNMFRDVYFMSQLPSSTDCRPQYDDSTNSERIISPIALKHSLLHLLITEARLATRLKGQITVLRSDFKWFGPGLPHSTIFAILKFFHVPQIWINLFQQFLQAPLKWEHDGLDSPTRIRRRGVPMSHALSEFMGEALLFCMDYSVNQNADGAYLYRLHDDFWIWGEEKLIVRAWRAMTEFSKVMGIEFNEEKTGTARLIGKKPPSASNEASSSESSDDGDSDSMSIASSRSDTGDDALPLGEVRWGFLKLDEEAGRFLIDQSQVDEHIKELKHQLDACKSVFSWVKSWNSYFARFFTNNMGRPAVCFGREHIEMVISTLQRIEYELFTSPSNIQSSSPPVHNAVGYLRLVIAQRFDIHDLPDGFFYFPIELGGLDLRNPVIPFLAMREDMRKTPERILEDAFIADEKEYVAAKERFEKNGPSYSSKLNLIRHRSRESSPSYADPAAFMPLEEFNRYMELTSRYLARSYGELLRSPNLISVDRTPELMGEQSRLENSVSEKLLPISAEWNSMSQYWKWVAELYREEMTRKYGGLAVVEKGVVPLGVLKVLREGKVKWQG